MDATDRFKRLVIVILVCFRHRSHDHFLGAQGLSDRIRGKMAFASLLARPCPFCSLQAHLVRCFKPLGSRLWNARKDAKARKGALFSLPRQKRLPGVTLVQGRPSW